MIDPGLWTEAIGRWVSTVPAPDQRSTQRFALLCKGRGSDLTPGEFCRTQNWISGRRSGNAVFFPLPADNVLKCMGKGELFLHDQPEPVPESLNAALAHLQFETIHPFLDGNSRLGRLLITLLLCEQKMLLEPILYLSRYLKTHRHL